MASFGKREATTGSILDRPLGRGRGDVSLSAFALLFSEVVQYLQQSVLSIAGMDSPEGGQMWTNGEGGGGGGDGGGGLEKSCMVPGIGDCEREGYMSWTGSQVSTY